MKKFLKITGIVVLTLIIIFLSFGLFKPEVKYTGEITINKPLPETFNLFNNIGTLHKWIPEIKSCEIVQINPGLVGSQIKMLVEHDGDTMSILEEITAYKENQMMSFKMDAGPMAKDNKFEFSDSSNSTVIRASYTCRGSNLFFRALFSFFGDYFKSVDDSYLKNFKEFAEQNHS